MLELELPCKFTGFMALPSGCSCFTISPYLIKTDTASIISLLACGIYPITPKESYKHKKAQAKSPPLP